MQSRGLLKYTSLSIASGISPIVLIFVVYFFDKSSHLLSVLFEMAKGYNRDYSERHLMVSTIASSYSKLAPLFVILMYVLCWNKLGVKLKDFDLKKWVKLLPGFVVLMVGVYYLTYVGVEDMSNSLYRVKRIIADNAFFLLIYYICLFLTNYVFIWMFLLYLYAIKGLPYFKKRA
ncbi:colicin immunity protein Cui [Klebsiella aerogenes]|uniref:colicin immunity protein Cui n=1 Tax=Klebsiella aerogenes TaxID=548 RepID=UPI0022EC3651|nr:colicin immunity protein Cui [Klebsiella aerogenes]MDA3989921.1 colicin immunity protein Cui [Klebsiella aerogenes]